MNILFIVTGVGFGDATREHANIEAFLKRDPNNKVMVAGYDNSYEYFKDRYPTIKIKGYRFTEQTLKFTVPKFVWKNYRLPFIWAGSALKLKKAIKDFKPDMIISDFEPAGIMLSKLVKKKCVMVFGYDPEVFKKCPYKNEKMTLEAKYFNTLYKNANEVIIPNLLGKKEHMHKYYSVNPIIRTKPEDLPKEEVLMENLGLKKEPVLIMLGGSTFGNILDQKILTFSPLFDEAFIIFGSKIEHVSKNVTYYPYKENIFDYLKVSKAVITLGGHLTLSECLAFKKPAMIFPIEDHVEQMLNAYMLEKIFHVRYDLEDMRKSINNFLDNLDEVIYRIPKIEFNGAEQVVDIIYNLNKSL